MHDVETVVTGCSCTVTSKIYTKKQSPDFLKLHHERKRRTKKQLFNEKATGKCLMWCFAVAHVAEFYTTTPSPEKCATLFSTIILAFLIRFV